MKRGALSRPVGRCIEHEVLTPESSFFDYGCGKGDDVTRLSAQGFAASGWDPAHRAEAPRMAAAVVNLGYVVNVIEDPVERADALTRAWRLTEETLIVSARLENELTEQFEAFGDGHVSTRATFQKFYTQHELKTWIEQVLDEPAVPAAPGIFYVFRCEDRKQEFLASRFRRRTAAPRLRRSDQLYQQHTAILDALIGWMAERGRLPEAAEFAEGDALMEVFGSIKRAFAVVKRVTDAHDWGAIADERRDDLLVYLALARFQGRKKFSDLPRGLQLDIKAFCGSHKQALTDATELMFAAGDREAIGKAMQAAAVGKKMPEAIYVHSSAISAMPPLLRVYEGCARVFMGDMSDCNVIKLVRDKAQVSYLSYPGFDTDPHPALAESVLVKLGRLRYSVRNYRKSQNPPILHRKELFVAEDYPLFAKFARLTEQEERWGLLPGDGPIGNRIQWEAWLAAQGATLRGHRLVRRKDSGEA